jgi:hypothetical protein
MRPFHLLHLGLESPRSAGMLVNNNFRCWLPSLPILGEPVTQLQCTSPRLLHGRTPMTLKLKGSCRCGEVRFSADSHAPVPFMRCYCSICRKTAGGGGHAINLHADKQTFEVEGKTLVYRAKIEGGHGSRKTSTSERHFCALCGSALWVFSPEYPDLLHPFSSAIDSELPRPPSLVHMMLGSKALWVEPQIGPDDQCFDAYPDKTLEDWHRLHNLWID